MIRQSPARKYLLYLATLPGGPTAPELLDRLIEEHVDALGVWYLERLRQQNPTPDGFDPYHADRHAATRHWLYSTGTYFFYYPDSAQQQAEKIFRSPRGKEFVESMLIANAPALGIADNLPRYAGLRVTADGILRFHSHYFDTRLVDSMEMQALLAYRQELVQQHSVDGVVAQGRVLKQANWNNPRKFAAQLPIAPISALAAQTRMGVLPRNLPIPKTLEAIEQMALLRSFEKIATGGPAAALDASSLLQVAQKAKEYREELSSPDEALLKKFQRIRMTTHGTAVPTVGQLTGGAHTVDMGPVHRPALLGDDELDALVEAEANEADEKQEPFDPLDPGNREPIGYSGLADPLDLADEEDFADDDD